jgi:transposase, IS5 family
MRKKLLDQLPLTPVPIDHVHAAEVGAMGDVLDQLPEAVALVHEDLCCREKHRIDPRKGRDGMAAEQVLRAAVLKQMLGFSYERLAFALADSNTYRSFCRIGFERKPPTRTALQKNVKRVKPETWQTVHEFVVRKAIELGVETGNKVRTDCMVVESNIHHPNDSSLLGDCVRVFTRLMTRAKDKFGLAFTSHRLRAKRRVMEIANATSMTARVPLYRDLVKMTEETLRQAEQVAAQLDHVQCATPMDAALTMALAGEIRHFVPLANMVLSQTERRIFRGESVPAEEKVVSIFEPHTDIIVKAPRETEYGHKVCLTTGASGLVTAITVEKGNPADQTLATGMIQRQKELFGKVPRQASFDGGFATRANLAELKTMGVEDVAFHKRRGIEIEDMTRSKQVFRKLRAFRAGIEGTISFLKRVFHLERCTWSGFRSFRAYVFASATACNLLIVARHVLATRT